MEESEISCTCGFAIHLIPVKGEVKHEKELLDFLFLYGYIYTFFNAMLLGLSLFIFMKHHHFVTFPAVFQVLWLVSLDVSLDNEVNLMFGFWKRSSWK